MMRLLIAAALLGTAAAPALADARDFRVGGFDRVVSSGPWQVRIHTGRGAAMHADGPRDLLERMQVDVAGGELRLDTKPGSWSSGLSFGLHSKTVIDIEVPMIAALTLNGPGDASIDRIKTPRFAARLSGPGNLAVAAIETQEVALDLSGPGRIALEGRAGRASVRVSGTGSVEGRGLTVGDADVRLSGVGNIALTAFGNVTGSMSGIGSIRIGGRPRCAITRSGIGSVKCG
jgi:hypothetical protein